MPEKTAQHRMLPQWTILGIALLIAGMYLLVDGYLSVKSIQQDQLRLMTHFSDDIDARLTQRLGSANEALQNIEMSLDKFTDRADASRGTNASLTLIANSLTGVRAINIVTKDGDVLATSGIEFVNKNFADTERFQKIASGTDPYATYVSPIFKTPVGLITTAIARQIIGEQGKFNGYVMAVLDPLYFRTLLRSALYDKDVDVSLLDASGEYLLTSSMAGATPYKNIRDASAGLSGYFNRGDYDQPFEGDFNDQGKRIAFVHKITLGEMDATEPLYVLISREKSAMFADLYREAAIKIIFYVAFAILSVLSLLFFQRRQVKLQKRVGQQETAKKRAFYLLKESEGRFRSLFEETQQAIMLLEDGHFVDANKAALNMLRMTRLNQLLKTKPVDLSPQFQPDGRLSADAAEMHIAHALTHGSDAFEWEHIRADGEHFIAKVLLTSIQRGDKRILQVVWNDITQEKKALAHITYLAFNDPDTGMPNRIQGAQLLQNAISDVRTRQSTLALMQVDLRSLRHVNDTYGHHIGDELIKVVGTRLKSVFQDHETHIIRLGGDQFMVVLPSLSGEVDAASVANQLLGVLTAPYLISDIEIIQTFNIGFCFYPTDGNDEGSLMRAADTAVNEAKRYGPNVFKFFDPKMAMATVRYIETRNALLHAIENQEFELHYQPQINLQTGKVVGAEALIRWNRPGHGLVVPGGFIDVAEESGLIEPIGRWVLQTACVQAKAWVDAGLDDFVVAVNLSAVQFRNGRLPADVREALAVSGLPPQHLELELTESILIENANELLAMIGQWRKEKIRLSIDDFGTGYSSLAYLKTLKVDKLKIDRSFVIGILDDPADLAIAKSIIDLGQGLGLVTIAEGIDDPEIATALKNLGCDEAQGFYYAKGMPAAEFMTWLKNH